MASEAKNRPARSLDSCLNKNPVRFAHCRSPAPAPCLPLPLPPLSPRLSECIPSPPLRPPCFDVLILFSPPLRQSNQLGTILRFQSVDKLIFLAFINTTPWPSQTLFPPLLLLGIPQHVPLAHLIEPSALPDHFPVILLPPASSPFSPPFLPPRCLPTPIPSSLPSPFSTPPPSSPPRAPLPSVPLSVRHQMQPQGMRHGLLQCCVNRNGPIYPTSTNWVTTVTGIKGHLMMSLIVPAHVLSPHQSQIRHKPTSIIHHHRMTLMNSTTHLYQPDGEPLPIHHHPAMVPPSSSHYLLPSPSRSS